MIRFKYVTSFLATIFLVSTQNAFAANIVFTTTRKWGQEANATQVDIKITTNGKIGNYTRPPGFNCVTSIHNCIESFEFKVKIGGEAEQIINESKGYLEWTTPSESRFNINVNQANNIMTWTPTTTSESPSRIKAQQNISGRLGAYYDYNSTKGIIQEKASYNTPQGKASDSPETENPSRPTQIFLTANVVPEPLTILGTGFVAAALPALKKANKKAKK